MSEEKNARGNVISRGFHPCSDRYRYDFGICSREKGWIQYDTSQDASYFGVWVNVKYRQTFTYCEGDTTLVDCPTVESFRAELESMEEFYGDPPPMALVIDDNGVTQVYDEQARPMV